MNSFLIDAIDLVFRLFWRVCPPKVLWLPYLFLWLKSAVNGLPELRKESHLLDEVELGVHAVVALGVCLHPGALDADDDAAVAEVLDADPFGAREEFEDVDRDGDEMRVARTFHSLEREFRIRCRLSRC